MSDMRAREIMDTYLYMFGSGVEKDADEDCPRWDDSYCRIGKIPKYWIIRALGPITEGKLTPQVRAMWCFHTSLRSVIRSLRSLS